jgi:hypothetical protein
MAIQVGRLLTRKPTGQKGQPRKGAMILTAKEEKVCRPGVAVLAQPEPIALLSDGQDQLQQLSQTPDNDSKNLLHPLAASDLCKVTSSLNYAVDLCHDVL